MNDFFCQMTSQRKALIREHERLNGLDFVEVDDEDATVTLVFLNENGLVSIEPRDITISTTVDDKALKVKRVKQVDGQTVLLQLEKAGAFADYVVQLSSGLSFIDPTLARLRFQFKLDCREDCAAEPGEQASLPTFSAPNYLAKDYDSFRQLLLDQMASQMPDWQDRSAADPAITLVELLAYAGDYLSYRQDAVTTEGYLDTARDRISLRRLARLVDYHVHEGRSARAYVQVQVEGDGVMIPAGSMILSHLDPAPGVTLSPNSTELAMALSQRPTVFSSRHEQRLFSAHNEMPLYGWGAVDAQLAQGATTAALVGHFPNLQEGDLLIFQEKVAAHNGLAHDADRSRRHAIRLTSVEADVDPVGGQLIGLDEAELPITHIAWSPEDALPFPLIISTETTEGEWVPAVSVALGNILVADQGQLIDAEPIGTVPPADPATILAGPGNRRRSSWQPSLSHGPLSRWAPFDAAMPANHPLASPSACRPQIMLLEQTLPVGHQQTWYAQRDLLASSPGARDFVVETDNAGVAKLRFGDNQFGRRPVSGSNFSAIYRVGCGRTGNLGIGMLAHLVAEDERIVSVHNPLPAFGGHDPVDNGRIRDEAPHQFRRQLRAVTPADYARRASDHPEVQRAAAARRWSGSWYTIFLASRQNRWLASRQLALNKDCVDWLATWRLAGHDIELLPPCYVPLEIGFKLCAAHGWQRGPIERALRRDSWAGVIRLPFSILTVGNLSSHFILVS